MNTKVEISEIAGWCFGSKNAVETATNLVKTHKNVTLFKQILHNKTTVQQLFNLGIKQVDNLQELNKDMLVVIRAHGETKETFEYLNKNQIPYVDCTCKNVARINKLVQEKDKENFKIILLGKHGFSDGKMHPEVLATSSYCSLPILIEEEEELKTIPLNFPKYFLVVQTTFNREKALKIIEKIKKLMEENNKIFEYVDTTCGAQRLINEKAKELAKKVNKMLVVGGKNSSNSKELYNNVSRFAPAFFVENLEDVKNLVEQKALNHGDFIGITGGASTFFGELEDIKAYLLKNL